MSALVLRFPAPHIVSVQRAVGPGWAVADVSKKDDVRRRFRIERMGCGLPSPKDRTEVYYALCRLCSTASFGFEIFD